MNAFIDLARRNSLFSYIPSKSIKDSNTNRSERTVRTALWRGRLFFLDEKKENKREEEGKKGNSQTRLLKGGGTVWD